jgi:hypothetical protein
MKVVLIGDSSVVLAVVDTLWHLLHSIALNLCRLHIPSGTTFWACFSRGLSRKRLWLAHIKYCGKNM